MRDKTRVGSGFYSRIDQWCRKPYFMMMQGNEHFFGCGIARCPLMILFKFVVL